MTRRAVRGAAVLSLLALPLLPACATTYDASIASDQASTSTSSTLPSGSPEELLPRLVAEAAGLSTLMIEGGDASSSARRVDELWQAIKVEVNERRPDLLSDFAANVQRCADAVRYRRAADADKAAENLGALVDAYLAG